MTESVFVQATPAGLFRRLAALVYDGLLLLGVLFTATALALLVAVLVYGSEAVQARNPLEGNPLFMAYLLVVWFVFYGWFWTHGGQTLGMRAWKLRLVTAAGQPVSWGTALQRFLAAVVAGLPLGLGFFWLLIDEERMTWHDRWSKTVLVHLPR